MLRPYTVGTTSGGVSVLQPALQKLGRQPLQPPREQGEAIGDEEDTQQDEQRPGDAVHTHDVGATPLDPGEDAVERARRHEKGGGEPGSAAAARRVPTPWRQGR